MSVTVLRGQRLIDGTGSQLEKAVVVVDGSKIREVGIEKKVVVPQDAKIIDLPDCTLMPGLMDVHFHFMFDVYRDYRKYEMTHELLLLRTAKACQKMLEAGFTTVRDAGGGTPQGNHTTTLMAALRDAFDEGTLVGPRLVVPGMTIVPMAHLHGLLRSPVPQPGVFGTGPWELRKILRQHLQDGADYIKTSASGGIGPPKEDVTERHITQEELNAIVDEAHAFHKLVACHCHSPESKRMAMAAGVDTLEHCVLTDDDEIAQLVAEKKIVVPTMGRRAQESIDLQIKLGAHEATIRKMKNFKSTCEETFRRYHAAGVKLACGTDGGWYPGAGQSAVELAYYVDLGMTPMDAITTATANAAEAIGRSGDLGTVEPGKLADIIAVRTNPLENIRILTEVRNIRLVMKNGKIVVDRKKEE